MISSFPVFWRRCFTLSLTVTPRISHGFRSADYLSHSFVPKKSTLFTFWVAKALMHDAWSWRKVVSVVLRTCSGFLENRNDMMDQHIVSEIFSVPDLVLWESTSPFLQRTLTRHWRTVWSLISLEFWILPECHPCKETKFGCFESWDVEPRKWKIHWRGEGKDDCQRSNPSQNRKTTFDLWCSSLLASVLEVDGKLTVVIYTKY